MIAARLSRYGDRLAFAAIQYLLDRRIQDAGIDRSTRALRHSEAELMLAVGAWQAVQGDIVDLEPEAASPFFLLVAESDVVTVALDLGGMRDLRDAADAAIRREEKRQAR